MRDKARDALEPTKTRCDCAKRRWEQRLQPLGGDPSSFDMEKFRPLRLSREEDWSDWLGWLLQASTTGVLAETIFGSSMHCDPASFASPKDIWREEPTEDRKRRADIVVEWRSGAFTDMEVKIWDEQLDKTFDTAKKLEALRPKGEWHHFILLTQELVSAWDAVASTSSNDCEINLIEWRDIVRGLRRCLWEGQESLVWQVWAWTYCAAIEQKLLGLLEPKVTWSTMSQLQMALSWLDILAVQDGEK